MFSGGDSSGEGMNFNQFGHPRFTPTHSQSAPISGVANGATAANIDWASLAQQWIQMRDNNSTELEGMAQMPETAPPPPNISGMHFFANAAAAAAAAAGGAPVYSHLSNVPKIDAAAKAKFECEKGEADMDMDDDEDNNFKAAHMQMCPPTTTTNAAAAAARASTPPPPPAPSMQLNLSDRPDVMQCRPDWYGAGGPPPAGGGILPLQQQQAGNTKPTIGNSHGAVLPQPAQWNMWPPPRQNAPTPTGNPTAHIPSLLKMNVTNPNTSKSVGANADTANNSTLTTIDAAKRKILPAWIREGLEKMEREKQKQMDQQRSPSDDVANNLDGHQILLEKVNQEVMVKQANLSAIVESENSGNEDDDNDELHRRMTPPTDRDVLAQNSKVKARLHDVTKPTATVDTDGDAETTEDTQLPTVVGKSYEHKLADLMIIVRRTLTELLLEVTNDEISQIANETVKLRKTKGLAAYADSSSGDDDDDNTDNEEATDNDGNIDSEEELKASIRQKRRSFIKTAEEIDEYVSAAAAREDNKLKYYTELEHDKKQQQQQYEKGGKEYHVGVGGKRGQRFERSSRKERTTRFSDNKDAKSMVAATASYITAQMHSQSATATLNAGSAATKLFPAVMKTSNNGKLDYPTSSVAQALGTTNIVPPTPNASDQRRSSHKSRSLSDRSKDDRSKERNTKEYSKDHHKSRRRRRSSSRSSRSEKADRKRKRNRSKHSDVSSTSTSASSSSSSSNSSRRSRRRASSSSSSTTSRSSSSRPSSKYSRTSSSRQRRPHSERKHRHDDERVVKKDGRPRSSSYRSKSSRSVSKNHEYDRRDSSYDKHPAAKSSHQQRHKSSSSSSAKHHQPSATHTSTSKRRDRSRTRSRSKTRSSYKSSSSYKRH